MPMSVDHKKRERPSRSAKPTLRTIADQTGFAVTTVSRALNNDPLIAESTRVTVAKVAAKIGYVPDRAAQRLRTGRTRVISLLVNPTHEFLDFTSELLAGLISVFEGTGYSINIIPDFISGDRVGAVRNILQNNLADGLIFTRTECFDERVRVLLEADFPFVSHGRTEFTTPHPFVDFDNEVFARMAVERLVAKGRKRIGIVLPDPGFTFAQHLRYGFLSAVRETGVAYDILDQETLDSSPDRLSSAIRDRLTSETPPDGFVCVGEVIALATLGALEDCAMQLGGQIDIVAKRASPVFSLLRPKFDTVFEDVEATGRDMAKLLLRRLEGEAPEDLQVLHAPAPQFL